MRLFPQLFGDQGPSYQPAVSLPEQERKTGEEEERQLYAGVWVSVGMQALSMALISQ